ncbi:MAG: MaoC/PaaZ C-terminal domain-containing protein [Candidatus Vecturithrix sp.]|jgi:acyl dehydratase|nr:MaoC/PaaZ C-terminal domain-containing protein [Candidatus Vecturithrix sp.]
MKPQGKYFEDFVIGEEFRSPGRTITETDVMMFAWLSGDYNQIHTDEEYCKQHSIYGARIAHGLFGLAIVEGLKFRVGICEGTAIASLEWTWRFKNPLLIGDTVHVRWKISKKRETSKPDRGIVWESVQLINQRDEIVAEGEHVVMMQRKSEPGDQS